MSEAKIGALAPWFGAKRTLAPRIVEQLGPHRAYWEPFCGSMAVLLAKEPATMETANDLHGDLVNLARVIRDERMSGELDWKLRRTLASLDLFLQSREVVRTSPAPHDPDVTRAYHYFLSSWLGINGTAGARASSNGIARRFTSNGGAPAMRFVGAVDSLPWWHERLRKVFIDRGCGVEVCEKVEDKLGSAVYADPPYIEEGGNYLHNFKPDDHERLAAALTRLKLTRVVVSYYAHPRLEGLYPGWTVLDCETTKGMVNSGKRNKVGATKAPEVLLINGPALSGKPRAADMFAEVN